MTVVAIIQARMGSTRLPEKVVADLHGLPVIVQVARRVREAIPTTVVAVPPGIRNRDLCDLLEQYDVPAMQVQDVDEADVLSRYYVAATHLKAETVVRVTGDCPLIHPTLVRLVAMRAQELPYVSNFHDGRTWPRGLDCEAFSMSLLARAHREAEDPDDREHVTPFMRRQPLTDCLKSNVNRGHWRWTLDTEDDLAWMRRLALLDWTPPRPSFQELVAHIEDNPNLLRVDDATP